MFLKKPSTSPNFYKPILAALALVMGFANGQTPWNDSQRNGNEARFLFGGQIQRYDLATKAWLPSVTLPRTGATAMAADAQGAAVAYGTTIYRYATDFTNEAAIGSTSSAIQSLFLDGNLLIAVHSTGLYARITIFNRTTGTQLSTRETYVDSMYGASHAPETNRLYGRTQGISPADIVTASYTDAGVVSNVTDSPYHGDFLNATKTWVFPNETRVVDSSGTVYAAPGLTYSGTLAGSLIDIAFNDDVPIVLRNAELAAFGSNLLETGRGAVTTSSTSKLYVTASEAFVFSPANGSPGVQIVSLSSLNAPQPGEPVDPNGLPYAVDDAFLDKDGNLLLFSKAQSSLFRWSPAERGYTGSFPLIGAPDYAAYSAQNHSAYFAYASQTIRKMDLGAAIPVETPLFVLPQKPSGLATAGEFIFASDPSGAWESHYVFSPDGSLIQSVDWNYESRVWEWDPVKRRMYFFRDGSSPNDLHYETIDAAGKITGEGETPYHGDFTVTPPIRVSPDGSKVVIGSGVVFETTGLTKTANLANGFTDAVWTAGKLVTLREISGVSQLQVWEGDQFLPGSTVRQFNGTPLRLFNTAQGLLLVTSAGGAPRFILLDAAFNPVFISPTRPVAPSNLTSIGRTVDSVSLQWADNSDNEDSFRVEYRIGAGTWITATTAGAGVTSTTVTGLPANTTFEFRVLAVSGTLDSTPSSSATVRTLSSPDEPAGEPYNLRITRIFRNSITLEWQDNGDNETGFRIIRSTTAGGTPTVFSAPAGATSFTSTGLAASTTYYFRIQIENGAITGDLSAQISGTTRSSDAVPSQPSSLTVSALSPTSVSLKWTDASTNEDGFKIERSTNPVTTWTALGTVPYNTAAFTDSTATPDTKYTYRVAAFNGTGTSNYRTVTTTTPALGGVFTGYAIRSGSVQYFAFNGPDRIERYDLLSRTWLPSVPLNATATALWVDESAIYVAEDRAVVRFSLAGGDRTSLGNAQSTVRNIFTIKDVLAFAPSDGKYVTLDKTTGIFLSNFSYWYSGSGFSVVPNLNRVYFRSTSVSPSDIHYLEFDAAGKFITGKDSPYHGTHPSASRTFVFPNGARVADDSGTVYSTDSLAYNNSLAGSFTDLAFHGADIPIVLRGDKLFSYTNSLLEAGSLTLTAAGLRVAVDAQDAVVFIADGSNPRGLRVQTVPLSSLNAPQPGQSIDPNGLPYAIDDAFVDKDGNLLLFSKAQLSLFRWSPAERGYTGSFPLIGAPDYAAYSAQNHSAYFAYASQTVRKMDLGTATPQETPLCNLPGPPRGFTMAGEFAYVATGNGLMTFSPAGVNITKTGFTYYYGNHNTWDPVKRRVYHFRDGISPNDLHFDTISSSGAITGGGETPYHGDFTPTPPVRVNPDGSKVIIGSGVVFNADGLTKLGTTVPAFTDALWWNQKLLTLHASGTRTQIRRWDAATLVEMAALPLVSGTPARLLAIDSTNLALITMEKGVPRIYILNQNLQVVHTFISTPTAVEDTPFAWTPPFEWSSLGTGAVTVSAPILPAWLKFSNGVLSGTPLEADSGDQVNRSESHRVVLRAVNAQNQSEERDFLITALWRNDPPVLPETAPRISANDKGEDIQANMTPFLTDPDGKDAHHWVIAENTNPVIFSKLSIDDSGLLDIAFAPYVSGTSFVTIKVTDLSGESAESTVEITLPDLPIPRVTIDSEPTLSRLTGLYEQRVTVTNVAARAIAGFDLFISGLRTGVSLYNGSSTADGGGSIAWHRPMQAGESVVLVLEYHASPRGTVPTPLISAAPFTPEDQRIAAALSEEIPAFAVNRFVKQADGSVVIEFNAVPGKHYRIQYSADAANWKSCPVAIQAGGTKVQWIDRGPPWTDSPPSTVPRRFYRVQLLDN